MKHKTVRDVRDEALAMLKADTRSDYVLADLFGRHADTVKRWRLGEKPTTPAARMIVNLLGTRRA